jgi:dTDP-4-dehydrorhamnose reductase
MSLGRILITGKNGQVGWELQRTLSTLGEVVALDRTGMDLASPDSIRAAIRDAKPSLIVNAAAYTAVDKAESEPELAMAINGVAPGILAEEAKRLNALLIHYSTDYVFDGTKQGPYTEDDLPNPLSVYGKTKLAGERAIQQIGGPHLICRTSWVYGARGKNFLLAILRLAKERNELRIVNDQFGAPTWSRTIAETTAQVVAQLYCPFTFHVSRFTATEAPITHDPSPIAGVESPIADHRSLFADVSGIYNLTSGGETTWFGFAKALLESSDRIAHHPSPITAVQSPFTDHRLPNVVPIPTEQYPTPAKRPRNSVLSNRKLTERFGLIQPNWQSCLVMCLEDLCR